jgi:hypothetical protein
VNEREAKRLAILIAWDDLVRSLDTSDEWVRHPETDRLLTLDEVRKVKDQARQIANGLEARAARLLREKGIE